MHVMNYTELRMKRKQNDWSEQDAAERLGLSQSYLSMLENGKRPLTTRVARRAMRAFGLPASVLPPPRVQSHWDSHRVAKQLAALDYPGFSYMRTHTPKENPAVVLLGALSNDQLEARMVEALPWLLLRYWDLDQAWLLDEAKRRDLQNRLGFVVALARRMSESSTPPNPARTETLAELEAKLDKSRLVKQDTLGKPPQTATEREWVMQNRTPEAEHWNVMTDLRPEHFQYVP
jgi:transcriptional regulator with XRE-family HTH domain